MTESMSGELKDAPIVMCSYLEGAHVMNVVCKDPHRFVLCPDPYCRVCRDQDGEIRDGWEDAEIGETHAVR